MSEKREFKGVWIPKDLWFNTDLKWIEKLFLIEIDSLDNDEGCFASNNYFAKFFNITPQRCSQIINKLIKGKYLRVKYEYNGQEIKRRVLNIFDRGIKFSKKGIKESLKGYQEKFKDNSISINNINNSSIVYTNQFFKLTEEQYSVYKNTYDIDIDKELKKMEAWLMSNPKKQKRDYLRFINNWLSKGQAEKPKEESIYTDMTDYIRDSEGNLVPPQGSK